MVLIPIIYKVDNTCATEVPFILLNLSTEDIHLTKGEMLEFLVKTGKALDEITNIAGYYAPCHDENDCAEIEFEKENNVPMGGNFITFLPSIY